MVEHRYVACKLHGLNAQWSEEKKQSYIRHAIREYNIHKTLVHHHIVRLWDTFEIDQNTFCTVLEYCSGIYTYHFIYMMVLALGMTEFIYSASHFLAFLLFFFLRERS